MKFIAICVQLLLSISLLLPSFILPLQIRRPNVDFCSSLIPGYYLYTRKLPPIFLLVSTIVTFATYTFIFVHSKCKKIIKEDQRHGEISWKSISLTIVNFAVHLTTVLLSVPVSLHSVYLEVVLKVAPSGVSRLILQLLLTLVFLNFIIDPVILI